METAHHVDDVHHVISGKKYGPPGVFGRQSHLVDGVRLSCGRSVRLFSSPTLGWVYACVTLSLAGLVTTEGWNTKMVPTPLW